MKNSVLNISKDEANKIKSESKDKVFIAEIDGAEINSWEDYWTAMARSFSFPELPAYMKPDYHSYYDIMTDLSWIETDSIILIINKFTLFLKGEHALKDDIIRDFKDYLLPFWEEEVEKTVVGGKKKSFCVYLVDSEWHIMQNDWRLLNQQEYLMNAKLKKMQYTKPSEKWDHDHCAFCWDKFSENDEDLQQGYCTPDQKYWVCEECFNDFKEMFGFKVE